MYPYLNCHRSQSLTIDHKDEASKRGNRKMASALVSDNCVSKLSVLN